MSNAAKGIGELDWRSPSAERWGETQGEEVQILLLVKRLTLPRYEQESLSVLLFCTLDVSWLIPAVLLRAA